MPTGQDRRGARAPRPGTGGERLRFRGLVATEIVADVSSSGYTRTNPEMAELRQKIKNAINETRILILGSQILLGFQFQSAFRQGFDQLPIRDRAADITALGFMLAALAILIAPSAFHRIAEGGEDSGRLHRFTSAMAAAALLPFACSFGLNLLIATDRVYGGRVALAGGSVTLGLTLFFWYGFELIRRRKVGRRERTMAEKQSDRRERTPLPVKIEQMLIEARVILPGAQALLGFQLMIVITPSFENLAGSAKLAHLAGLCLVTLAVVLLMAPAAYHRLVYAGEDTQEFHEMGSRAVTAATVPLALGIAADVYVVVGKITGSLPAALVFAGATAIVFFGLWHVYPLVLRARTQRARAAHAEIPRGLAP